MPIKQIPGSIWAGFTATIVAGLIAIYTAYGSGPETVTVNYTSALLGVDAGTAIIPIATLATNRVKVSAANLDPTAAFTGTKTSGVTQTVTGTLSGTGTGSGTVTISGTGAGTDAETAVGSDTVTATMTRTKSAAWTQTDTSTATTSTSGTAAATSTVSGTQTISATDTETVEVTASASSTVTDTWTATGTGSATVSKTATGSTTDTGTYTAHSIVGFRCSLGSATVGNETDYMGEVYLGQTTQSASAGGLFSSRDVADTDLTINLICNSAAGSLGNLQAGAVKVMLQKLTMP